MSVRMAEGRSQLAAYLGEFHMPLSNDSSKCCPPLQLVALNNGFRCPFLDEPRMVNNSPSSDSLTVRGVLRLVSMPFVQIVQYTT
jgi:hypothetical protein